MFSHHEGNASISTAPRRHTFDSTSGFVLLPLAKELSWDLSVLSPVPFQHSFCTFPQTNDTAFLMKKQANKKKNKQPYVHVIGQ